MTSQELDALRDKAMDQTGKVLATPIAITPGILLELYRLAVIGMNHESQEKGP